MDSRHVILVIGSVDEEAGNWVDVTVLHGLEVNEHGVESFEKNRGFFEGDPLLVLVGNMEALHSGREQRLLLGNDSLVIC